MMHYIPDPKLHESYREEEEEEENIFPLPTYNRRQQQNDDDYDEEEQSRSSSVLWSSKRRNNVHRLNHNKKKTPKRRLKKIVTRAFTKHKPAPPPSPTLNATATPNATAQNSNHHHPSSSGTPNGSEQDALLVIHCDRNSVDTPSLTMDSFSVNTTPSTAYVHAHAHQQGGKKSKQQYASGFQKKKRGLGLGLGLRINEDHNHDDAFSSSSDDEEDDDETRRQQRIARAQAKIRKETSYSIVHGFLAIGLYICLSIAVFSFGLERWSVLDSSYFAVVTFTTIGYGDLVPDTTDARIFTCFWALSGVACLGISLGVVGSNLIDVHETKRIKVQHESNNKVIGLFDAHGGDKTTKNNNSNNVANTYISIEEGKRRIMYDYLEDDNDDRQERATEQCCTCKCTCSPKAIRITGLLIFFCGVLYLISRCEGWDVTTTIYYGIITASTVGYGDLATKTETGRTLAIIFIPFAVGIMGSLLEMVAGAIIDARRKKYESYLHNKPLTLRDIRVMDSDGDGNVTRAEFLQFMLVAMNQVDKGLLERLNHHFDQLDYDNSGTINKDDLATMAQQRMQQATGVSAMHHRQQQQQQAAFQRRSTRRTDNRQLPQYGSVV